MGGVYQWPGVAEVMQYRRTVRQLVSDLITSASLTLPVTMESPWVSGSSGDIGLCPGPRRLNCMCI